MGKIVKADAWCNGEVAYLGWQADGPIADCLGFMITRVRETGPTAGRRRILPTWIAFRDQSNPDWLDQDSSVWPIQSYEWRDLTLRRSRDSASVRPIDFKVHYEIVPVGLPGPGRKAVPKSSTAVYRDGDGKPRYRGTPRPLALLADPVETPTIDVTHSYPRGGRVQATYTNGILSTQNLLQQLEDVQKAKPQGVAAGPATDISKGLLTTLKEHIPEPGDRIRKFLTADVLGFLLSLIDRTEKDGGELYLALYELHDPELIARLTKLTKAGKAHVILSTAGSENLTPKTTPPTKPRRPDIWDTENHDARAGLHAASAANVQDRLFNNSSHIGHNKFAVYVKGGVAKAVLSGSTNWTETGLCTQSNNAILIEDDKLAGIYLDYWKRLQADVQPDGRADRGHLSRQDGRRLRQEQRRARRGDSRAESHARPARGADTWRGHGRGVLLTEHEGQDETEEEEADRPRPADAARPESRVLAHGAGQSRDPVPGLPPRGGRRPERHRAGGDARGREPEAARAGSDQRSRCAAAARRAHRVHEAERIERKAAGPGGLVAGWRRQPDRDGARSRGARPDR